MMRRGPMKVFDRAMDWILEAEGPDTNDPNDPGGYTRFGISKRAHPDVDVPNLTRGAAERIYRRDYWNPIQGESLPPVLAFVLFDAAVNQGVKRAVLLFQEALGVQKDGVVGPRTVASARELDMAILSLFLRLRARAYIDLAVMKPKFYRYLDGWLTRLFNVQQRALLADPHRRMT